MNETVNNSQTAEQVVEIVPLVMRIVAAELRQNRTFAHPGPFRASYSC
jgi:hypothetical protein